MGSAGPGMTTDAVIALMRGSDWVTFVDRNIILVFLSDDPVMAALAAIQPR
jgi:hypothetical protein